MHFLSFLLVLVVVIVIFSAPSNAPPFQFLVTSCEFRLKVFVLSKSTKGTHTRYNKLIKVTNTFLFEGTASPYCVDPICSMWLSLASAFLFLPFAFGFQMNHGRRNYFHPRAPVGSDFATWTSRSSMRFSTVGDSGADLHAIESPDYYCQCSQCKTAYEVSDDVICKKGKLVRCSVCDKVWFQSQQRLLKRDTKTFLVDVPHENLETLRSSKSGSAAVKHLRPRKIEAFIGNIPPHFEEKDLLELFAEYGVLALSVVRDTDGQNKGFAFIQFATKEDESAAISEMNGFYVSTGRKLAVRTSEGYTKRKAEVPIRPKS